MTSRSHLVVLAPATFSLLLACVQLNEHGWRARDAAPDLALDFPATNPDAAPDATEDRSMPVDTPSRDAAPTECTPQAIGCTTDNRSTRACNDQGQWVVTGQCPNQSACSGGLCLCSPEFCDEGAIVQTQTSGWAPDLAVGGRFVFLAANGPRGSIRRFDIQAQPTTETVVRMGEGDVTVFALDSDPTGNLVWCSEVVTGATRTGQVMDGDRPIDSGACTQVRRRDELVYYKTDVLHRRARDGSQAAKTVTREALAAFDTAGDSAYFVGELNQEAFLKRVSLADPSQLQTILRRPNASFFRVMADTSHVYLITEGQILEVPELADAQAEVFWQEAGLDAWAITQTDSHVYWTATTTGAAQDCSEAQVFRRPKTGGPVTVLSRAAGYCAGPLVIADDHLYTAIWAGLSSTAPTKILRIRL